MKAFIAQARVELILTVRRGESVLVALLIPAGLLGFFSLVRPSWVRSDRPAEALLPGILTIAVMATALVSAGIATGFERRYGILKRLGATPLPRATLLGAKAAAVLSIEIGQIAILLAAARLAGAQRFDLVALAVGAILGAAAFASLGFFLAGILPAETNLAVTNLLFLVLLLFGGTLIPVASLPDAIGSLASVLPSSALTRVFEGVVGAGALRGLSIVGIWAVAAVIAASLTFSWE